VKVISSATWVRKRKKETRLILRKPGFTVGKKKANPIEIVRVRSYLSPSIPEKKEWRTTLRKGKKVIILRTRKEKRLKPT